MQCDRRDQPAAHAKIVEGGRRGQWMILMRKRK